MTGRRARTWRSGSGSCPHMCPRRGSRGRTGACCASTLRQPGVSAAAPDSSRLTPPSGHWPPARTAARTLAQPCRAVVRCVGPRVWVGVCLVRAEDAFRVVGSIIAWVPDGSRKQSRVGRPGRLDWCFSPRCWSHRGRRSRVGAASLRGRETVHTYVTRSETGRGYMDPPAKRC